MKGKVIFWICLERHPEGAKTPYTGIIGNGTVRFKLFGQRCQKCSSESYENAMWYPEEVVKVRYNHSSNLLIVDDDDIGLLTS